jgi:serine O-acetyltransferase
MFEQVLSDIQAAKERDPAARSTLEIVLCYSGLHAILAHRVNHWLWTRGFRLTARFGSQVAKFLTGIEIHPGATIGTGFFIDHGAGTVIGETAEVGNNCTLFHGVTLGGTGKEKGKRHPTLEDDVTIGAHAQIIGSITIGKGSVIGAGAVVLDAIPPYCTVVGPKAYVVRRQGERVYDFRHDKQPRASDPALECMLLRIRKLESELTKLRAQQALPAASHAALSSADPGAAESDLEDADDMQQGALVERWAARRSATP